MNPLLEKPFHNIGLAISGGGYRAAAFSLGAMHYMHRIQWEDRTLLHQVKFITSTSGGSITNAFYTQRLYEGMDPADIFRALYMRLQGDDILNLSMQKLTSNEVWKEYPGKTRNLINAFAITYDKELFNRKTLGVFWDHSHNPHVEEMCLNATDMNNGLAFRISPDGTDTCPEHFGNNYIRFRPHCLDQLKSLRIADAVAASSCFPGGFEPIVYPHDFAGRYDPAQLQEAVQIIHNNELTQGEVAGKPFGLIDGGVVDNQGLNHLMEEDARRRDMADNVRKHSGTAPSDGSQQPFNLLIVCDVASYFMDPYPVPVVKDKGWKKIRLRWVLYFLLLMAPFTVGAGVTFVVKQAPWYSYLSLLPSVILSGLITWVLVAVWKQTRKEKKGEVNKMLKEHLWDFLGIRISTLISMMSARKDTIFILANELFLKQIRRMYYDTFYNGKKYEDRRLSCLIYDLGKANKVRRNQRLASIDGDWWQQYKDVMTPSARLEDVAEEARNMDTTLWVEPEKQHEVEAVVSTGQFTMCYNLIKYLNRLENNMNGKLPKELADAREFMLEDWKKFQEDPYWLQKSLA